MNVRIDWQQVAAFVAVAGAISGLAWRLVMGRARVVFVPRAVHDDLAKRVTRVELVQEAAPTGAQVNALTARISAVETGIAVSKETLNGVSDSIKRVEKMLDLLVQHQLNGEKPA